METKSREIKTVMHTVKARTLRVKRVQHLSPRLKRITLSGPELAGFTSLSPDDHIKVFFPYPGETQAVVPVLGPGGPQTADGRRPLMRDYTPRRFDANALELDIEFVLHGDGPGSTWAAQAEEGQMLSIGGPRGSKIVPYAFEGYLMMGDETAIPSIARRLEEMPAQAPAVVVIEVEDESQKINLPTRAATAVHWVYRLGRPAGDASRFQKVLGKIELPKGDTFTWIAMEKSCAMQLKAWLVNEGKAASEWIKATGYWSHEGEEH